MTGYEAEVVADSISPDGVRLVSILASYPLGVHQDILRHRMISHSVSSLRAIPPEALIEQVENYPFVPEFARRVIGMGVGEPIKGHELKSARNNWTKAMAASLDAARRMIDLNVDKSRINWLLAPYLWTTDLMTATEWSNFFALRDHSDARPEVRIIARMMREAMDASEPFKLDYGEWHMPLLTSDEYPEALAECNATRYWDDWKYISAGRCARVSYDKQNEEENHERSISRARSLIESAHMSPFEHISRPMGFNEIEEDDGRDPHESFCGNFRGWIQMRKEISNEDDFSKILASREAAR
jgi:thymidylate synthase ThyX